MTGSAAQRMAARLGPARPVEAVMVPRWRLDRELRRARLGAGPKHLAQTIVLAMSADGTVPGHVDRRELCRRAEISYASFARHMAVLEHAGLIVRSYVIEQAGPAQWKRWVQVAAAPRFTQATEPISAADTKTRSDQSKYHSAPPIPHKSVTAGHHALSVVNCQTVTRAAPGIDDDDPADRAAVAALTARHWPLMARSRSDLPDSRPSAVVFHAPPCDLCGQRAHGLGQRCAQDPRSLALAADTRPY